MKSLASPRERILTTATRLFYQRGVRATGIDQIIAEAAVAKATLYYHFPSKSDLVRAYLQRRHKEWIGEFAARLDKVHPKGLAALADALGIWFSSGDFNGCAFINVTMEAANDEWRQVSCAHKDALRLLIEGLIGESLAAEDRSQLAGRALILVEGMIVRFQMTRDPAVVDDGRAILTLLEAQRLNDSAQRRTRCRR